MIVSMIAWYVVVALGGATAFGALRRLGLGAGAAWATARVSGLVVQAYLAWMAGCLGLDWWWWLGFAPLAALVWWGREGWRGVSWRHLLEPELIGLGAFLVLAFLRLPTLAVTATEKPMDLAILTTLLRPGVFPPTDPWLAGFTLPYYYWGFMPWVLPAKVLGFASDVVFNLLLPTLALVSAQAGWALARALGGSRRSGIMAAGLVVFTGTLDGWRQWLSGTALGGLDLWPSSRQIPGTITEFPLFTFHLGDLHPHLLSVPLMLVAIFLGRALGSWRQRPPLPLFALLVLVFGAAAAANPWCAVAAGLGILLAVVGDERAFTGLHDGGWKVWARVVAVGVFGWLAFSPFWLGFHPPADQGFGLVTAGTRVDHFVLLMAGSILPLFLVGWELSWRWGGLEVVRRQLSRATWLAGTVVLIILSRRFVLGLAAGLGVMAMVTTLRGRMRRLRPALALTLVPLALLLFMELIYLKDPYGIEFYRMNTVFKAVHMAFTLLAVTAPVLLGWLRRRRYVLATVAAAVVLATGLPQLAALTIRATSARPGSWSGLAWMEAGEPEVVAWLRTRPRGTVIVEAVGDAYSDAGRMSASSGVPAVLGWENHEGVWRGPSINEETARRRRSIEELYKSGNPERVRQLARQLGARYVIVGAVEKRLYPAAGVEAARQAGPIVFERGVCAVVEIAPSGSPAPLGEETGRNMLRSQPPPLDSQLSTLDRAVGGTAS